MLWPNVSLSSLPRFEQSLDKWFKRSRDAIWITEYGHETKPDGEKKGISRALQATYALQAFNIARKDARVGHVRLVRAPRPPDHGRGRAA